MYRIKKYAKLVFMLPSFLLMGAKCGSTKPMANKPATVAAFNLLSERQFNELFPRRNPFYTYAAFLKAIKNLSNIQVKVTKRTGALYQYIRTDKVTGKTVTVRQDADWNETWAKAKPDSVYTLNYGDFCTAGNLATNKKELAAFLANIAHETRFGQDGQFNDGLIFIHEKDTTNAYLADNDEYPPVSGKRYYGRGPIQLSYNGNYGKASVFIFGNKHILLNNPKLIETDPVIAFETAVWFWMTPDTNKPSPHDAMIGKWQPSAADKAKGRAPGFGMTINIINGPVECGKGENVVSMNDRINFYRFFLKQLGATDPNCACSCGEMGAYSY